jgi:predicted permease
MYVCVFIIVIVIIIIIILIISRLLLSHDREQVAAAQACKTQNRWWTKYEIQLDILGRII